MTYKVKYIICTEFDVASEEEANKINEKNLNAIFSNGEFQVKKFKLKTKIFDTEQEPETEWIPIKTKVFCDRNICASNEYNGISCHECEVTKSQEQKEDLSQSEASKIYKELDKLLSVNLQKSQESKE